ncbi:MAG: hypothetical protein RL514_2416 [Verrucomicrobiota bacterium]|jgi:DNA-binding response OmpR family regulator
MIPIRILLVEDDAAFAETVRLALTACGYEVVVASDGREALRHYDPPTVALVLTDLLMPDMEGVELILALRRRDVGVKIIAMSGGGTNQPDVYLRIAQQVGALKTLAKPFPLEELQQAVKECLAAT